MKKNYFCIFRKETWENFYRRSRYFTITFFLSFFLSLKTWRSLSWHPSICHTVRWHCGKIYIKFFKTVCWRGPWRKCPRRYGSPDMMTLTIVIGYCPPIESLDCLVHPIRKRKPMIWTIIVFKSHVILQHLTPSRMYLQL